VGFAVQNQTMNINGKSIDEWLLECSLSDFPLHGVRKYPEMYSNLADHLYAFIHPEVNQGALMNDGHLLTDHGPEHVKTVIRRASQLVAAPNCTISPYEAYILLVAIHFHDVGNIYGREGHELRSKEIFKELGEMATTDHIEKYYIHKIAQAHGGTPIDKIEQLQPAESILNFPVRIRFLAALLKFADELADDSSRASRRPIDEILKKNQIYHKYAHSLKTVEVDHEGKAVNLDFWLSREDAIRRYGKGDTEVYLIDEIWKRTYKTHLERIYCMRFLNPEIRLDRINVKVSFLDHFDEFHDPIGFRLEEKGYPSSSVQEIFDICPELTPGGRQINGESIKLEVEGQVS
jgi:hypothetical protein